jgi:hypothetical protein
MLHRTVTASQYGSQRTVSMSQLARLIQIASVVMAIAFFAVALRG